MNNEDKFGLFFMDNGAFLLVGIYLAVGWIVLYFLIWGGAWLWAWMDDKKVPKDNPLIVFVMTKIFNYKCTSEFDVWAYRNKNGKKTDGGVAFFIPLFVFLFSPFYVIFYEIILFATTIIAFAHMGRFGRRHKKLFDKHVDDPKAHTD